MRNNGNKKNPIKIFFKIFLFNILLTAIPVIAVELYFIHKQPDLFRNKYKEYIYNVFMTVNADNYMQDILTQKEKLKYTTLMSHFRPDENINSDKKGVIFSGCSFVWGDSLEDNETVSAITARLTGRPVYNRGGRAWGLDEFYYMSKQNLFYDSIKSGEPEYLFYVLILDHENRINRHKGQINFPNFKPKYTVNDNKTERKYPLFFERLYFIYKLRDFIYMRKISYDPYRKDFLYKTIKTYFTETAKEIHKHYPGTKIVILYYPTIKLHVEYDVWDNIQSLKNEGYYDLVNLNNLVPGIYRYNCKDGWHPSTEAWEKVVPELIKRYKL